MNLLHLGKYSELFLCVLHVKKLPVTVSPMKKKVCMLARLLN